MYLFAILSSLICIQLILTVSSGSTDGNRNSELNDLIETPTILDNEEILNNDSGNDEEYVIYIPRSTSFLRFGRQIPSSSRFDLTNPNRAKFLRFGRQIQHSASNNFLRFGRKGEFLRFG